VSVNGSSPWRMTGSPKSRMPLPLRSTASVKLLGVWLPADDGAHVSTYGLVPSWPPSQKLMTGRDPVGLYEAS
jgi:hypothetical protein